MVDFNEFLNRKYANLEAQTANQGLEQAARANLLQSQAGSGFFQAEAEKQRQLAETGRLSNLPGQLQEQTVLPGARSYLQGLGPEASFNLMSGGDVDFTKRAQGLRSSFSQPLTGFKKGTAEVMKKGKTKVIDKTGNGKPDVDTVPAMLAEGEAVLNVAAAERMGRENIKQLNQQGLRDMNMDDKARPVIKKGGRLGAYSGVEMAMPKMKRMAQPEAQGMMCGTSKVKGYAYGTADVKGYAYGTADVRNKKMMMKVPKGMMGYAEGTEDAGASTPASAQEVNDAGVRMRGMRSYARGTAAVPGVTAMEMAGFERQRDRNQLDEAVPYGTSVMGEPAGEQASVTPSRNTARLREQYGLTAEGFAMGTENVYAQDEDEDAVTYAAVGWEDVKNLGSRAMSGLRGMVGSAPVEAPATMAAAAPAAAPAASASEFATRQAAAADSARAAMGEAPSSPRTTTPDFAARQAEAARSARIAMGETASTAAQPLRGGAGAPPMAAATTAAAPAAAAPAAGGSGAAFRAGQAVRSASEGLRSRGVGAVPIVGGALTAGQALSEMPAEFYNDPNVPVLDKASQAGRTLVRTALPYVGGAIGSGVAPVAGTVGGAALGAAAASQIEPEGQALRNWRASQPAAPTSTNAVMTAEGPVQTSGVAAPTTAAAPRAAATGGGGGGSRVGAQAGLRGLATMGSIMGSAGSQAVLQDLTRREEEAGRNARSAVDQAIKAAGGKTVGKTEIFDRPQVDPETGRTVPGAKREDLEATFDSQYLPMYAASRGVNPAQLPPLEKAKAKISFDLNRAGQEYSLRSGNKGFDFEMPVDINNIQYVDNLPMLSRLVGRARGETSWREGFWDNGGIVITDGRARQEIPIDFLEESGALSNPALSQLIKTVKAKGGQK